MPSPLIRVGVVASILTIGACSGDAQKNAPAAAPAATASPAPPASKTIEPAAQRPTTTGRDPSTLQACEIVTAADAARTTGGSLLNSPKNPGPVCTYVVETGGTTESYQLSFQPVGMIESYFAAQSAAEKGEKIDGPWDEAYIHPQVIGKGFSLTAVHRGDVAFEVKGERKAPVLEIARLAGSRLPKS